MSTDGENSKPLTKTITKEYSKFRHCKGIISYNCRRLIAKTEEVEAKENLIREKEKLFLELKNILARQPGSEIH
jgi:hypothetical protein